MTTTNDGRGQVRSDVYLGFGPVKPPSRRDNRPSVSLKNPPAINTSTSESAKLTIVTPEDFPIDEIIHLIQWFGTLGSRSRNGWGSIYFDDINSNYESLQPFYRCLSDCLQLDWAHAIGMTDNRPLIWRTEQYSDWQEVIEVLADIRVKVRRVAKDNEFVKPDNVGGIHLLGYPAGKKWALPMLDDKNARLANQLRFKVIKNNNALCGLIFHLPHKFPGDLQNNFNDEQRRWIDNNELTVWQRIHESLDNMTDKIRRIDT